MCGCNLLTSCPTTKCIRCELVSFTLTSHRNMFSDVLLYHLTQLGDAAHQTIREDNHTVQKALTKGTNFLFIFFGGGLALAFKFMDGHRGVTVSPRSQTCTRCSSCVGSIQDGSTVLRAGSHSDDAGRGFPFLFFFFLEIP
jgi:hypothetical protein